LCSDLTDRVGLLRAVEAAELAERFANAAAADVEGRRRRLVHCSISYTVNPRCDSPLGTVNPRFDIRPSEPQT
jgi:hypothetical protein